MKPTELAGVPTAAAAVRHAASVSIRTKPAGHSLLPHVPDKYAPARDSPARAALGRAAAAAQASTRAVPRENPAVSDQYSVAAYCPQAPWSTRVLLVYNQSSTHRSTLQHTALRRGVLL